MESSQTRARCCTWSNTVLFFGVISIFFCYLSFILTISTLPVAAPSMKTDYATFSDALDTESYSKIISIATGGYFVGKLFSGFIIDFAGGPRMIVTTMVLINIITALFTSICLYLPLTSFPAMNGTAVLAIVFSLWTANRLCMAAMWPSVASSLRLWIPEKFWGLVMGSLVTGARITVLSSELLFTFLLGVGLRWQFLFVIIYGFQLFALFSIVSVILLGGGFDKMSKKQTSSATSTTDSSEIVVEQEGQVYEQADEEKKSLVARQKVYYNYVGNDESEIVQEQQQQEEVAPAAPKKPHPTDGLNQLQALWFFFKNPLFWGAVGLQTFSQCSMEEANFVSLYLQEAKGLTKEGEASRYALAFTFGYALTLLFVGFIYDRVAIVKIGRLVFTTLLSLSAAGLAAVLWIIPSLSPIYTALVLAGLGACAAPQYFIVTPAFTMQLGGPKHTAKLSTILDSCGFLVAMAFDWVAGIVVKRFGWSYFMLMLFIANCGVVVSSVFYQFVDMVQRWNQKEEKPSIQ